MVPDANRIESPVFPEELRGHGGAKAIIVDPPWDVQQKGNFGAIRHYPLMTLDQIKAMPVGRLCAQNAVVWLWATAATLPHAYDILKEWGLTPRGIFVWYKPGRLGLGNYIRNCCEFIVIGTKGKALPAIKNQPNFGAFPAVLPHSTKPFEQYPIIERMYPEGPYLELFARRPRDGWYVWGNEIDSDIVIPGYPVPKYSERLLNDLKKRKEA